ncbi:Cryptochrome DASH [compost metagenome]
MPLLERLFPEEYDTLNIDEIFFKGGEEEALKHLHDFLHTSEDRLSGGLKKNDMVAKLSAWLAIGSLSPREVYWRLREAENSSGHKPYFAPIIIGLLWRDYYRFMFKKYGNTFFRQEGFKQEIEIIELKDNEKLNQWKNATTGHTLIDSLMRELNVSGYLTHNARMLVATYLIYELQVSWVLGAAYFEEQLIDYCPASNWGNWASIAGVGNDQRLSVNFSFEKQLKVFDPKGVYTSSAKV